jgi:bacterioferritin
MPLAPNGIVEALQAGLSLHWAAIQFYRTIASHLERWGYPKLGSRFAADAAEEMEHAEKLIARLEYYDSMPTRDHDIVEWPRDDVPGILEVQLDVERSAADAERAGYAAAVAAADGVTADLFAGLLADSENSIKEIEAARLVIKQIGLDNYLAAFI